MSKHTPEPWKICNGLNQVAPGINNLNGDSVLIWKHKDDPDDTGLHGTFEECLANAARIVACVNACAGMEDPQAEIEKLKADNARMLNVIRVMQEATANDPTWINTNRVLSSILKDCTHA